MTDPARLDVIIVHYHAAASARDAVAALRKDARTSGLSIRIIVADNGSTPDERSLLRSLPVDYLDVGRNAGYAGAVNAAFGSTAAEFVVLMNEDVLVLPGCVGALCDALAAGAAVVGPRFFWDRGCRFVLPCTEERTRRNELLKAGARRDPALLLRARGAWREHARRHWRACDPLPTLALSGALLGFRRDAWAAVGPFDEGYRLYFEENDWLHRIARAGLSSLYVPAARAVHLHNPRSSQTPERLSWESESFARFGERYYGKSLMRRVVACAGEAVIPEWQTADGDVIRIDVPPEARWPLWVELTPSPFGFPAAAASVDRTDSSSRLQLMRDLDFLEGTLYVQVVDDAGAEIVRRRVTRIAPADPWPELEFVTPRS